MRAVLLLPVILVPLACSNPTAKGADSAGADAAVERVTAIPVPKMGEGVEITEYSKEMRDAWTKREPALLAAFEQFPDDDRVAELMSDYWQSQMREDLTKEEAAVTIGQIEAAAKQSTNPQLKKHAAFWRAFYISYQHKENIDKAIEVAEQFANLYPTDPRGAVLFNFATVSEHASEQQVKRAYDHLAERYPESQEGKFAKSMVGLMVNVGKPFDFSFKDEVTGKQYTDESMRGKVLVIDFWATWCAPCIESLPKMKTAYAKYRPKGVEFIGVSLDETEEKGGRKALLEFVKKNEMAWPQYYLRGANLFLVQYGVSQIPTIFIVDREGVVRAVDGYRVLDRTLDRILAEG